MNTLPSVVRDERTEAVENASYKWSTIFLLYALLLDCMFRGFVRQEAAWDLLAFVAIGGGISTLYRARQKALPPGMAKTMLPIALVSGVIAFVVAAVWQAFFR